MDNPQRCLECLYEIIDRLADPCSKCKVCNGEATKSYFTPKELPAVAAVEPTVVDKKKVLMSAWTVGAKRYYAAVAELNAARTAYIDSCSAISGCAVFPDEARDSAFRLGKGLKEERKKLDTSKEYLGD